MARHSLLLIVADTYVHCRVRWMVGWSRCNHNDWKKSIQTYQLHTACISIGSNFPVSSKTNKLNYEGKCINIAFHNILQICGYWPSTSKNVPIPPHEHNKNIIWGHIKGKLCLLDIVIVKSFCQHVNTHPTNIDKIHFIVQGESKRDSTFPSAPHVW